MDHIQDKNHLIISKRAASITLAVLILIGVFCFIAGFFWGYRHASSDLQSNLNKVSFSDQINYSTNQPLVKADNENIVIADNEPQELTADATVVNVEVLSTANELDQLTNAAGQKYYAELIGFGHLRPAQVFVDKMQRKGYPIIIKNRISKNGKGKTVNWYQAITENFEDRAKLVNLIEIIKKNERLKDIKIKKV